MEIKTLKDLKIALKDVPDEILEEFGAGYNEEPYVELLVYGEEEEFEEKWDNASKKCPAIHDINKWIQNISNVNKQIIESEGNYDGYGFEEPISSKDKVE